MNASHWVVLPVLVVGACTGPADEAGTPSRLAVTNAVIIDGLGSDPVPDGVVLVMDGLIVAAGPSASVEIPSGTTIIDAGGGAVLPGLADMHVHLVGGWDGEGTDMLGYRRYLNALLYAGVTTVFDVGNVLPYIQQIRAEVDAGRLLGPRIFLVGPLVDGPEPVWPPLSYSVPEAGSVRRYVEQLSGAGVDAIKGYAGLDAEMVDSLVHIAGEASLPVVVDLGGRGSYPAAVRSGVAALAHAPSGEWPDEEIAEMVAQGTVSISTLAVLESFSRRRLGDLGFLQHPLIASTTPPWFLEALKSEASRELSEAEAERAAFVGQLLANAQNNVRRMHRAGVSIVAGTDAPYPGVFQGEGIHRELELLVQAGLSPVAAIQAATHNAAALMGEGGEWGAVAPGMVADLIVLRANPVDDISATREIVAVIRSGAVLNRDALEFDPTTDPSSRTVGSVAGN